MPLYEYRCEKCGKRFEVMQKFSDTPLTVHEKCGGQVERLISAPALQFKGSGWYVTDYAKGQKSAEKPADNGTSKKSDSSEKPAAGGSDSSSSTSTGSSETKSDSKPTTSDTK